jgi:SAM-dependent methyltransferase
MTADHNKAQSSPSPFVESWIAGVNVRLKPDATNVRAANPRALDLAMGRGRHALLLARHGFVTFGVDSNFDAVRDAVSSATREGRTIRGWCADLTAAPLPVAAFDVVVVARYLQRDLFPAIKASVKPGGSVIYETFTVAQLAHGVGPRSPDHLLKPGELKSYFDGWEILFYEETDGEEAVARLAARSLTT